MKMPIVIWIVEQKQRNMYDEVLILKGENSLPCIDSGLKLIISK